jgi:translation elongation factor EF-1alpha
VDWDRQRFDELCAILSAFLLKRVGFESVQFVPVSGLLGINLAKPPPPDHPLHSWPEPRQTLVDILGKLLI